MGKEKVEGSTRPTPFW